jgi:hypothetical protein
MKEPKRTIEEHTMSKRQHDPKDETIDADTDAIEDLDVDEEAEDVRAGRRTWFEDEEPTNME